MKHSDFCQLWAKQEDRFTEWRDALRKQCVLLRDALIARLEPPTAPWVNPNSGEEHSYVDLLYLHPETKRMKGHIPAEALTEKGELMFGLAVTFERGRKAMSNMTRLREPVIRLGSAFQDAVRRSG